ncbi:MAG: hypothetical protein M1366_00025 [Patescibacteria group bacterium]|nr:hypothetical protein [Patescibacteria group bacterium]
MLKLPDKMLLLVILSISFVLFLLILPKKISAADNPFNFSFEKMLTNEQSAENVEKNTGQTVIFSDRVIGYNTFTMIGKLTCALMPCQSSSANNGQSSLENTSALGLMAQAIGTLYDHPPASAIAYTQNLLANSGFLATPANAQGIGFSGLVPLLPLWQTARNIAYTILIIIMIAIGFMIIFRMKIDPKTVISIQAALPKIIVTLLLITFSYPIAGFFIDLMYLAIAIVIQLMASAVPNNLIIGADFLKNVAQQQQEFMGGGWAGIGKLASAVFSLGLVPSFFQQAFFSSGTNLLGYGAITIIIEAMLAILGTFTGGVGLVLAGAPLAIILFIIGLGLLFTFIRIFFLLLNSYIQLLLTVIIAPILLLQEAIPGRSAFGQWIQNIIANLIVFPTTVAVIYFSWIFTSIAWSGNLWSPPLIPAGGGELNLTIPGTNQSILHIKGNPLAIVIGLGIIFMAPNMIASVKKLFHPKAAIPVTAGSAFAPVTGAVGTGMGAMSQFYYMKSIVDMFSKKGDGHHQ